MQGSMGFPSKGLIQMVDDESRPRQMPPAARRPGAAFVGRQRELAELNTAREEALSGQGRLVMLVGEPGIGKTRSTQELAAYAENRGARVFSGRCYEEEGTPLLAMGPGHAGLRPTNQRGTTHHRDGSRRRRHCRDRPGHSG